jgi:hypothetical protein
VPPLEEVKWGILHLIHDHLTAGHLGQDKMTQKVQERYYWPGMKEWIEKYVKGCATCQQNKILTHHKPTLMYWIPTKENMRPFQVVAMDLITGLPTIKDKNAILTIVDQGCLRSAVFLPCNTKIMGLGIA